MKIDWQKDSYGGWQAEMPGNVKLWVSPDRYAKGFAPKAARGTQWRAGCSHWSEATRTISRFGRDAYMDLQASAKDAMRLAESIYAEALSSVEA